MINKNFVDMFAHGGINESRKASCIMSRYTAGITNFKNVNSGVLVAFDNENFRLESRGGSKIASCLNTKSGDIYGKKQTDDCICVPIMAPDRGDKKQNGRRLKENGDDQYTLTAADRHGVAMDVETVKVKEATKQGYKECRIGGGWIR